MIHASDLLNILESSALYKGQMLAGQKKGK
jgi:hypothetical protein